MSYHITHTHIYMHNMILQPSVHDACHCIQVAVGENQPGLCRSRVLVFIAWSWRRPEVGSFIWRFQSMGIPKNGWFVVCNGKSYYKNWWFGGTPISGNIYIYICLMDSDQGKKNVFFFGDFKQIKCRCDGFVQAHNSDLMDFRQPKLVFNKKWECKIKTGRHHQQRDMGVSGIGVRPQQWLF